MSLPASSLKVVIAARDRGLDIEVSEFLEGTKTAAEAAAAIGCPVGAIVKSLVFMVDERPVLALVPGDRRLDQGLLAEACGASDVRRATLDEVRTATGYAAGGTPPFGHPTPLQIFADDALQRHDPVWAAAGTPTTVFPISLEALEKMSGPTWVPLSVDPA